MKSSQIQIRVTDDQKQRIQIAAAREGTSITEYVLSRVLPPKQLVFTNLNERVNQEETRTYALAELADLLESALEEIIEELKTYCG